MDNQIAFQLGPHLPHQPSAARTPAPIIVSHPVCACFGMWTCHAVCDDADYKPVYVSSHAEVSDLGHSVRSRAGEQAISSSNVSEKHNELLNVPS